MKRFKTRFLVMCGLMVLLAAMLAPIVAEAQCALIVVQCSDGSSYSCAGTRQGDKCIYDANCVNGGRCRPPILE